LYEICLNRIPTTSVLNATLVVQCQSGVGFGYNLSAAVGTRYNGDLNAATYGSTISTGTIASGCLLTADCTSYVNSALSSRSAVIDMILVTPNVIGSYGFLYGRASYFFQPYLYVKY
jgi:hypothetical protein